MNLLTYLQLDTAAFEAGIAAAQQGLGSIGSTATASLSGAESAAAGLGAAVGEAGDTAPLQQLAQSADGAGAALANAAAKGQTLETIKPASGNAVQGMNAVSAASGLLSGTATGTAGGVMALGSALKGLGVAAAGPIALTVALVAVVALLAKTLIEARAKAERLTDSIQMGNAQSGVETLRRGFERLVETMNGAVGLMRELRALTREGANIDSDKRLAQIELDRARELAAVQPGDDKGDKAIQEINARHDRRRTGVELDTEEASNTTSAAEMRQQQAENAAAIAERREQMERHLAASDAASSKAVEFGADSSRAGWFGKQRRQHNEEMTVKWSGVAQENVTEAQRIREEIEELERKNKILAEQASLYEKRNEVVAIRRETAGIAAPVAADKAAKSGGISGGISGALSVATDRLTRIGGVTNGAGTGPGRMESLADKQLTEAKQSRLLLEKLVRKDTGAVVG